MSVCVQGSPVEIQTPTHYNLIGRSMSAQPPVYSPSSILPPSSSHCAFIPARKKLGARVKTVICFNFLFFQKLHKSEIA
jgi:hypothetical protein